MGQAQSNNNYSSEVDTLNWSDVNTEGMTEGYKVKKDKNGIEIIDIDFDLANSESESETLDNVFQKLHDITSAEKNNVDNNPNPNPISSDSSPFISTEMYKKIMSGGDNKDNNSSPFVNTEVYNNIMNGGHLDDDSSSDSDNSSSSTSSSELMKALSEISLTSEDKPKSNKKHHKKHSKGGLSTSSAISEMNSKAYGFSNTSSEMIKTSENNYYINNATTTDTPYKMDSSSINTSDINLVSVDSRNGRRFI